MFYLNLRSIDVFYLTMDQCQRIRILRRRFAVSSPSSHVCGVCCRLRPLSRYLIGFVVRRRCRVTMHRFHPVPPPSDKRERGQHTERGGFFRTRDDCLDCFRSLWYPIFDGRQIVGGRHCFGGCLILLSRQIVFSRQIVGVAFFFMMVLNVNVDNSLSSPVELGKENELSVTTFVLSISLNLVGTDGIRKHGSVTNFVVRLISDVVSVKRECSVRCCTSRG